MTTRDESQALATGGIITGPSSSIPPWAERNGHPEEMITPIRKEPTMPENTAMCCCDCHQDHIEEKTVTIENAFSIDMDGDVSEEVADKVTESILKRIGRELIFGDVR